MSDALKPALEPTFAEQSKKMINDLLPGKIHVACPRCLREMIGGRCVPCERDRRDRFICAALTGILADSNCDPTYEKAAAAAVLYADAAMVVADASSK